MCLKSTLINHIEELEHAIVLVLSSNYPYTLGSISMNLINRPRQWENTLYLDAWWWHVQWMLGIDGPSWLRSRLDVDDIFYFLVEEKVWFNVQLFRGSRTSKILSVRLIIPPRHTLHTLHTLKMVAELLELNRVYDGGYVALEKTNTSGVTMSTPTLTCQKTTRQRICTSLPADLKVWVRLLSREPNLKRWIQR